MRVYGATILVFIADVIPFYVINRYNVLLHPKVKFFREELIDQLRIGSNLLKCIRRVRRKKFCNNCIIQICTT